MSQKVNYDQLIEEKSQELNKLFGSRFLLNLKYDDFGVYDKYITRKINGKPKSVKIPLVNLNIPRVGRGIKSTNIHKEYYKLGHRVMIAFTDYEANKFNIKDKEVVTRIMEKVREHAKKFYNLDNVPNPK